jgi:predicted transcriptional regulator
MSIKPTVADDAAPNARRIARIEEGIADADRGDFASGKEMVRIRDKYARRAAAGQTGSIRTN